MANHHLFETNVTYASEPLARALDILNGFADTTIQELSLADQIAYAQAQATVGLGYATLAVATQPDPA
ncbi:hypothetical protein [Mycobacterium syngnathidarum]